MSGPKDLNAPSRWNMRIWDDDKKEWLCQSDKDALTYYGFDITGGETTEFQGLPKWHPNRHLIWEQSTGLKDKNGDKEIYEYDIIDGEGNIIGNYHETPELLKNKTNLLIQGFGTKTWLTTYQEAVERGCHDA